MCLAIPMQIKSIGDNDKALVFRENTELEIDISLLEEPQVGDYVIVHAGFGIELLDLKEAETRLELFRQIAEAADAPEG